jgi:hypothetical protein
MLHDGLLNIELPCTQQFVSRTSPVLFCFDDGTLTEYVISFATATPDSWACRVTHKRPIHSKDAARRLVEITRPSTRPHAKQHTQAQGALGLQHTNNTARRKAKMAAQADREAPEESFAF